MAGRNNPVTLTSPGGATVRCAAAKRFAVTVACPPKDGKPAMAVLFRTNDQDAAITRARREARPRSRPVMLFSLNTGRFLGSFLPDGSFQQPIPVPGQEARR